MRRLSRIPHSLTLPGLARQSTVQRFLKAAGVVFLGIIACSSFIRDCSAGPGWEIVLFSQAGGQAMKLPNEETGIPELLLRNLASPDPNAELRAPDKWNAEGTKIPLNHVFEAMEEEGEAVRARAAATIEQQSAIEQYLLDLTFSPTTSDSGYLILNRP